MFTLSRRSQVYTVMTSICSFPFLLGLLAGITVHLYSRGLGHPGQGGGAEVIESFPEGGGEKNPALLPTLNKETKQNVKGNEKTFVRPRFVKDELNITKRLLVAILADNENQRNQENLFNWTLQSYVSDIIYFGNFSHGDELSPNVGLPDILDILRQISTHHLHHYQLFYIIPSSAAIHAKNIKHFTNPLSPSDLIYAGQKSSLTGTCDLQAGILLSRTLLQQVMDQMEWCLRNKVSYDQSQNLQNCIFHTTKVKCQDPFEQFPYQAQKYNPSFTHFDDALLFYGATNPANKNTLLHFLNVHNEKMFDSDVEKLETRVISFMNSSKYEMNINWPTGSNQKFQSNDRFDRDVFLHFNETHQLDENDYDAATVLDADQTKDIQEILNKCNLQSSDFTSGWKKVDATRGMDYVLEASQKSTEKRVATKKCLAVRELANPEIVPMPFVTESFRISLIIPVMEKDSQKTMNMLRSFAKNSIEKSDHIFLMLVFLYTPERPDKNNNNDFFKDVKQLALQISKKYKKKDKVKTSSHLLWYSLQTKGVTPSNMELMDLVTQKLDNKTIILLGSPDMEIRSDYFNRVRMNTILGKQVFCPIPFVEYHPSIVYGKKRPSASLSFNTSLGHFDTLNLNHLSFYKSDYVQARALLQFPLVKQESQLVDKDGVLPDGHLHLPPDHDQLCTLLTHSTVNTLHTLTAPEPSLRLRYEEIFCDQQNWAVQEVERCLVRRRRSLARRSQLAEMVIDRV
eukprot:GFUD01017395.1.p1 GENE.GFUD01017395.1~~GFUD01017395.1.p1  ORF type:complete len:741 (-),score=176.09 GFUD01017395.1:98-2320(-)